MSIEHQASTYTAGWRLGVTHALAAQNDFLQGDFYGDALQGLLRAQAVLQPQPQPPGRIRDLHLG